MRPPQSTLLGHPLAFDGAGATVIAIESDAVSCVDAAARSLRIPVDNDRAVAGFDAQDETSLHQSHLERAVALEFAENGKLSTSGAIC